MEEGGVLYVFVVVDLIIIVNYDMERLVLVGIKYIVLYWIRFCEFVGVDVYVEVVVVVEYDVYGLVFGWDLEIG